MKPNDEGLAIVLEYAARFEARGELLWQRDAGFPQPPVLLTSSSRRRSAASRATLTAVDVEVTRWEWACLACDVTGTGDADLHRCSPDAPAYQRDYWACRFRWANAPGSTPDRPVRFTPEQVTAIVAKPIARAKLAEYFGEGWLR